MPTNLSIFLAFVSGFVFLHVLSITRYTSQRWEGFRLLFWSGAASALLLVTSRKIVLGIDRTAVGGWLRALLKEVAPWDFSGTIGGALFLGFALPLTMNIFLSQRLSGWLASRGAGSLHHLLYRLVGTGKTICVTLTDRKVYVGFVLNAPRLNPQEKFFPILPLHSGYRDKDTGELVLSLNYSKLLQALSTEPRFSGSSYDDFSILIPFENVTSARVFDSSIYQESYFSTQEPPERVPTGSSAAPKRKKRGK